MHHLPGEGNYRAWLYQPIESSEVHVVRGHLDQERALGDRRFQTMVERYSTARRA